MKTTEIELAFGDGDYLFRLPLPQLLELEEKRQAGIGELVARVLKGRYQAKGAAAHETVGFTEEAAYRYADLTETIRLALIGGGKGLVDEQPVEVDPIRARKLVEAYVYGRPLSEIWTLASAILMVCAQGFDPQEGKRKEGQDQPKKARRGLGRRGSTPPG